MKIPKKIEKILDRREKIALELMSLNAELDAWLESKGTDLSNADIRDAVTSGCMIYAEPGAANIIVREYIENKL